MADERKDYRPVMIGIVCMTVGFLGAGLWSGQEAGKALKAANLAQSQALTDGFVRGLCLSEWPYGCDGVITAADRTYRVTMGHVYDPFSGKLVLLPGDCTISGNGGACKFVPDKKDELPAPSSACSGSDCSFPQPATKP